MRSQEAEEPPDGLGLGHGEALNQALGDDADLQMTMECVQSSLHGIVVVPVLTMPILVSGSTRMGPHGCHPEMGGVNADGVNGLFEGDLYLEAYAEEADDLDGGIVTSVQRSIRWLLVGCTASTNRTMRPAVFQSRSRERKLSRTSD